MVGVVDENMILRATMNNLTTSSSQSRLVSQYGSIKVDCIHMLSCIVLGNSMVNIISIWFVDNDSWPWIARMKCNIIVHENYYVFIRDSTLFQYLICVAYIRLGFWFFI
ncbi:hypothetical protein IC582_004141 [Cucumis melo]